MREARMTFGEHLEELRRRILFSLLYLTLGVGICFAYGDRLLEWTLVPHQKAFSGAQRDRLVERMSKTVNLLAGLADPRVGATDELRERLPAEQIHWEVLFARDMLLAQMQERLARPSELLAERVAAALGSAPEKAALVAAFRAHGSALAEALVRELAVDLDMGRAEGFLTRVKLLERKLKEVDEMVGPTETQEAIGWGRDLSSVREPLEEFRVFLEGRRDEALKSEISPRDLRGRVDAFTKLPEVLGEILSSLEEDVHQILQAQEPKLMVISYLESFNAYLRVSIIFGIAITIPFLLYEMWKFVGAGLYEHEQKYVVLFLPFSIALFAVGAAFGYYIMIPVGLEFLAGWGISEVNINITLGSYIGLFFTLTLILGVVFQTPLLMIFLTKIGVVDVPTLRKMRRVAVFAGVCLAVIMTPPDPFSWSLMALPMVVLYEIGILCCDFLSRRTAAPVEPDSA